ncbi:hypothetical protein ACLMJK_004638 [Lecanora helva]
MDGYDPTTMPYLGHPMPYSTPVTSADYLGSLPPMGLPEHSYQQHPSSYSSSNYVGSDCADVPGLFRNNTISNLPLAVPPEPAREYGNSYDDYQLDPLPQDASEGQEQPAPDANTSVDRDDELLSFSAPTYNFTLLDYSLQRRTVHLNARLHGMFFMADPPPTPNLYSQPTPPELTCYRRNLFQVTGTIRLPRSLHYILTNDGNRIPIIAYELCVSATESVEGGPVKLISVPWKTPANNAPPTPEDKAEKEPTSIPLDIVSNQDMDAEFATFPIAWKRLQFRIATANNGRRKELQQHFIARLKLVATLSDGHKVPIAEAKSAAIVVRGRSPRNFQQRRDLAVGGDKNSARKVPNSPAVPTRRATTDTASSRSPLKRERPGENPFAYSFSANDAQNPASNSVGWTTSAHGSSSAPALPTPTFKTPTLPSSKSTSSASPPSVSQPPDDYNHNDPNTQRPAKHPRKDSSQNRPHAHTYPSLPSPRSLLSGNLPQPQNHHQKTKSEGKSTDPADSLYEYFPLAIDDWQKPVDAVYRPHVVHHIPMAAGPGTNNRPGIPSRSKRYFSEDMS